MLDKFEKTGTGADKVDQYKWEIKDRKGSFAYIKKHLLRVDHDNYQRDNVTVKKVLDIAREWSWIACGAIHVARRRDGSYYIMDGQYRWNAAMRRSDIQDLPCMVFDLSDITAEAQGFIDVNTRRKAMEYLNRFKAENTAGNEEAIFVKRLVESSGRTIGGDGGIRTVRCVGALTAWVKRGHGDTLTRVWHLLDKLFVESAVHVHIVDALMFLELAMQEGHSLTSRKISQRLIEIGEKELIKATQASSAFRGKGGARIWAAGIEMRYNKGLQNKLPVREGALSF